MTPEQLLKLKQEIESAELECASLEGQQKQILLELKTEYDLDSIEEIDRFIANLEKQNVELEKEINELTFDIESGLKQHDSP
jgi:predicted  nucleic acid-binding Zn-ribbon protein